MILTDANTRNSHYSVDAGNTWKQIFEGSEINDARASYQSCAVSSGGKSGNSFALGFEGHAIETEYDCNASTDKQHCHDSWKSQLHGSSTGNFDTRSMSFNGDGTILYAVDGTTKEIAVGTINK